MVRPWGRRGGPSKAGNAAVADALHTGRPHSEPAEQRRKGMEVKGAAVLHGGNGVCKGEASSVHWLAQIHAQSSRLNG